MSHTVQINYEQIAVQCHSICEVAENQIAELDKMLADLEGSSSRLLNDQTEALRKQIEREKREHDTQFVKDELTHLQTLLDSIGKK